MCGTVIKKVVTSPIVVTWVRHMWEAVYVNAYSYSALRDGPIGTTYRATYMNACIALRVGGSL